MNDESREAVTMQVLLLFASLGVCMAWGFERAFDIIPCIILLIFYSWVWWTQPSARCLIFNPNDAVEALRRSGQFF